MFAMRRTTLKSNHKSENLPIRYAGNAPMRTSLPRRSSRPPDLYAEPMAGLDANQTWTSNVVKRNLDDDNAVVAAFQNFVASSLTTDDDCNEDFDHHEDNKAICINNWINKPGQPEQLCYGKFFCHSCFHLEIHTST